MSVTFTVESNITDEGFAACSCGGGSEFVGDYDGFKKFANEFKKRNTPLEGCEDDYCFALGNIFFHAGSDIPYDAPHLNVSNSNSQDVLNALGIEVKDYTGAMDADDLEGRILVAIAVSPSSIERPTYTEDNIIFLGRKEGYIQAKLIELQEVCEYARKFNRNVVWS